MQMVLLALHGLI